MLPGSIGRSAAGCIAAIAWIGLAVQGISTFHIYHSVVVTFWIVLAYFTILTNLLVALVFTALATRRTHELEAWVGGTMLSILLVGVIYALLLHGKGELTGGSAVANVLLHMVTPVLVPIFWLAFTRKGKLTWSHPLAWAIFPLAYLAYSLIRGSYTGQYPYPFLNPSLLGWQQVMLHSFLIAVAFLICSYALVAFDRRLTPARPSPHRTQPQS